jgi:hypothetical protein
MMLPLLDQTARHYQGEQSYLATVSQLPMFGGRFPHVGRDPPRLILSEQVGGA